MGDLPEWVRDIVISPSGSFSNEKEMGHLERHDNGQHVPQEPVLQPAPGHLERRAPGTSGTSAYVQLMTSRVTVAACRLTLAGLRTGLKAATLCSGFGETFLKLANTLSSPKNILSTTATKSPGMQRMFLLAQSDLLHPSIMLRNLLLIIYGARIRKC